MGGRLDIRWSGPYEVMKDCGKMRYRLKNMHNKKLLKKTVHCDRLKPYRVQDDGQKTVVPLLMDNTKDEKVISLNWKVKSCYMMVAIASLNTTFKLDISILMYDV